MAVSLSQVHTHYICIIFYTTPLVKTKPSTRFLGPQLSPQALNALFPFPLGLAAPCVALVAFITDVMFYLWLVWLRYLPTSSMRTGANVRKWFHGAQWAFTVYSHNERWEAWITGPALLQMTWKFQLLQRYTVRTWWYLCHGNSLLCLHSLNLIHTRQIIF